jgi:hypothetical protein
VAKSKTSCRDRAKAKCNAAAKRAYLLAGFSLLFSLLRASHIDDAGVVATDERR